VRAGFALSAVCFSLIACSTAYFEPRSRLAESEPVTCRVVPSTGSILRKTVCTSQAQNAEQAREIREYLEERERFRAAEEAARDIRRYEPPAP
jgi:hypothetical protein